MVVMTGMVWCAMFLLALGPGPGAGFLGATGFVLVVWGPLFAEYQQGRHSPLAKGVIASARDAGESRVVRIVGTVSAGPEGLVAPNGQRAIAYELEEQRISPLGRIDGWKTLRHERRSVPATIRDETGECPIDLSGAQWKVFADEWEQRTGARVRKRLVVLGDATEGTAVRFAARGDDGQTRLGPHDALAWGTGCEGPFVVTRRWHRADMRTRLFVYVGLLLATGFGPILVATIKHAILTR